MTLLSRITPIVVFAVSFSACASLHERSCNNGEQLAVHESLYFGTGKSNGAVTKKQWTDFLSSDVTARFPQGLTVSRATGQWRGVDGSIVRETTYVLHLVHPDDAESESAIREIVEIYKKQFEQEAVLREKSSACVSY